MFNSLFSQFQFLRIWRQTTTELENPPSKQTPSSTGKSNQSESLGCLAGKNALNVLERFATQEMEQMKLLIAAIHDEKTRTITITNHHSTLFTCASDYPSLIHPQSLTVSPWKGKACLPTTSFQGQAVKLWGCKSSISSHEDLCVRSNDHHQSSHLVWSTDDLQEQEAIQLNQTKLTAVKCLPKIASCGSKPSWFLMILVVVVQRSAKWYTTSMKHQRYNRMRQTCPQYYKKNQRKW